MEGKTLPSSSLLIWRGGPVIFLGVRLSMAEDRGRQMAGAEFSPDVPDARAALYQPMRVSGGSTVVSRNGSNRKLLWFVVFPGPFRLWPPHTTPNTCPLPGSRLLRNQSSPGRISSWPAVENANFGPFWPLRPFFFFIRPAIPAPAGFHPLA